ncbi:WD40 repeat-like protein [Trametes versicolor FP-101664 SS1]|uniref:WD40 repeat-like protein n=1 Tax=Trametes versicolor (strain FP-101664) TaxID=717944 RepID=R7SA23_TRAVS|nr:WD40 repeat-like protein [Trametes versicolor FP-101664 SS1]EIW51804.1 WD40 repeat-like protein [Trametes versicolor FP-101664 SS1]
MRVGELKSQRGITELAYTLLASLPRSRLAVLQARIAPLLKLDIVGLLPPEVSLHVFSYLSAQTLLTCALVSRRWRALADDESLWRNLCLARKWEWRVPPRTSMPGADSCPERTPTDDVDSDDEGMGDEEDSSDDEMQPDDSGFASMDVEAPLPSPSSAVLPVAGPSHQVRSSRTRHSAPSALSSSATRPHLRPNYKLLHQTHVRLRNRFTAGSYTLSNLQTRGAPNSHSNTIYCLQLYTYPETGTQVLFTGSKDRTIREWDLATGAVIRVLDGVHESSVLSICVHRGLLASASSDRRVVIWDLAKSVPLKIIRDHEDSVLCVRFDDHRLVSCSKDRTVRTYLFGVSDITRQHVLGAHRAAVNAVAISGNYIVSVSGDRSLRVWNAETGALLHTLENHHRRGIASVDFSHPFVLSGSSDKHIRLLDVSTLQGWSTSPSADNKPPVVSELGRGVVCEACGSNAPAGEGSQPPPRRRAHEDLVRSVALGSECVVSGSYDFTVKVWDRQTGALVADLAGGHTGRIFCVGFDCTKIVSCGEDQRICIWDFSHGIDTSFIKL